MKIDINCINVAFKDRDREVSLLKLMLNLIGINISYTTADLIHTGLNNLDTLKEDFSIQDAIKILNNWEEKWIAYILKES